MLDGERGPRERYNVERDIERFLTRRQLDVSKGAPTDEEMRQKGGMVISPRLAVLLDHFAGSHAEVAKWAPLVAPQRVMELQADATSCSRRLLEYLVPLEEVALLGFTHEPWDVPAEVVGLAAAALEGMVANFDAAGEPLSEDAQRGVDTYRYLAERLRLLEARVQRIPGQMDRSTVILPSPILRL